MGYIGRAATNAGSVNYLDDISSGFDGSDTTFTCAVKGTTITPGQENVYIYLDGVFQHPSDAYSISGSTITFTEAPVSGTDFTAYVAGEGAYLDDGTVSTAKLDNDAVTASKLDDDGTGFQVGDLGVGGSLTSGDKLTVTGRLRASGGIIGDLTGDVTGNVTGNTSGTAATVTGAAQSAITSVGTLTGLSVDGDIALLSANDKISDGTNNILERTAGGYITIGASAWNEIRLNTTGSTDFVLDNSGNVGIGNTVASTINSANNGGRLVIGDGSGNEGMTIYSGNGSGEYGILYFADGTSGASTYQGWLAYLQDVNALTLATSGTEKVRITSNGTFSASNIGTAPTVINNAHTFRVNANDSSMVIDNVTTSGNPYGLQIRFSGVGHGVSGNFLDCYAGTDGTLRRKFMADSNGRVFSNNGITFSSGLADADTLDDYEEGAISTSVNGITASTNDVSGTYTKVGRVVHLEVRVTISGKSGGTGNPYITLPFNASGAGIGASIVGAQLSKNTIISGGSPAFLGLYGSTNQVYANDVSGSYIGDGDWGNGVMGFSLVYNT